jgi:hypothetical protein
VPKEDVPIADKLVLFPEQIETSMQALAVIVFTVTITASVAVQPFFVTVTV